MKVVTSMAGKIYYINGNCIMLELLLLCHKLQIPLLHEWFMTLMGN